ncbi:putative monovalent cation/H+ antiporter subunit A [Coxiella burnetii]|uniref:putative monovalent cation/H+ antiporter subunit A n=1 Tax=Coxiella burnetii TaxID=777 RepID=UPI000183CE2F|nr:putative monovalent cation/H+ antiporter subunit A [Coxiella burnetii]ACJ17851.1 sodium/proton antiporter protein [Coxiella burnetii CbuG_Q212]ATN66283.1 cation:proton antiporter [Coxiella burnetii]OYK86756.1 Na(+)/H(+) antiporter subunit A [Coxiella burnetii]
MLTGIVIITLLVSALVPIVVHYLKGPRLGWGLALIPFLLFIYFIHLIPTIMHGGTIYSGFRWFPDLNINFSFYVDGLSLLFGLLITGIGIPIVIYSAPYLENHPHLTRYYGYLFLFMASMLGLVLANNLIVLFVFWELTSISSFLLIGLEHERPAARKAAVQALFVTVIGGLSLLASFILIGIVTHTYSVAQLLSQGNLLQNQPLFVPILLLMLIGAFTKSAQFPFHFWLPNAMEAPTPVSAYLHSATMVQVGIYLLARFHPLMSHNYWWFVILTTIGGITMLAGVLLAVRQTDMKLILAYTTITALGSLVFLLGSTHDLIIKAAVAFLLAHALYKATLFMAVGDIKHQTGTRDIGKVRGLHKAMPITFMAVLVAGASMAGLPPLLGFYVKELVYGASLVAPLASHILTIIAVFSNMIMAMLAFLLVLRPFWGEQKPKRVREANVNMSVNALLLASLTLLLSIFPFVINHTVLSPAVSAILRRPLKTKLTLWHGFTPSLVLSLITLLGAIVLYLKRAEFRWILARFDSVYRHGPVWLYDRFMHYLLRVAEWQTEILQNGKLRLYLITTFATIALTLGDVLVRNHLIMVKQWGFSFSFLPLFLATWLLISAYMTIWVRSYLIGLVFLGLFGIGAALFFIVNAAPDVAMTQALIETLIVIIVVLNLYRQPPLPKIVDEKTYSRIINAVIALGIGFSVAVLLIAITQQPFDDFIGQYFITHSIPSGHGRNVVNVVLIDFRGFDTLGEIIVVAVAALGIYGLLKSRFRRSGP